MLVRFMTGALKRFVEPIGETSGWSEVCTAIWKNFSAFNCSTNEPETGGDGRSFKMNDKSCDTALGRV